MKTFVFIALTALLGFNSYAQINRNMNNRIPQTNRQPTDQEIAKRDRMMKERRDEFIANFLSSLDGDAFQKEIVKQHLNTFYEAKLKLFQTPFDHKLEREKEIKKLEDTHFKDLEGMLSKSDMKKIKTMITGGFNEKEYLKKKKKKEKRKKNKD